MLDVSMAMPGRYPDEPVLPERLRPRFLRAARVLPLAVEGGRLVIAMADPLDDFAPAAIRLATGLDTRIEVAVPIELEAALDRLYPEAEAAPAPEHGEANEDDAERLKDMASEAPVIRLVNQIIAKAVETMASDIHIEPFEDKVRIRYRYDGDLQDAETQPARLAPAIISRLKILAKLDIAERRLPQDGRIRIAVRGQDVVFRIATAPNLHGEILVLRILDRSAVSFDYAAQGHAAPCPTGQARLVIAKDRDGSYVGTVRNVASQHRHRGLKHRHIRVLFFGFGPRCRCFGTTSCKRCDCSIELIERIHVEHHFDSYQRKTTACSEETCLKPQGPM